MTAPGRNDPCPCGSGKKFKQCCQMRAPSGGGGTRVAAIPAILQAALGHHQAGRLAQAEALYRQILQTDPDQPDALHYLGAIASHEGRHEAAIELIGRAIGIKPSRSMHYNLGNALQALGRLDGAAESYRKALALKPDYAEAYANLGNVQQAQGRLDEAIGSYRKALALKPASPETHYNLGNALKMQDKPAEAAESYRRACMLKPDYAEAYANLGNVLRVQGKLDDAISSYRRTLALKPDQIDAYFNLGSALKKQDRLDETAACLRKVLALKPDHAEALNNLGITLQAQGKLDEAIESYRRALEIKPDLAEAYSTLLFLYGYHTSLDPAEHLALARKWELACVSPQDRQAARSRIFKRTPLAGRRLRVGYVSGDYRQHAVSYFVEQLFARHDRARIELFAYSNHSRRDAITERLEALVEHWIPVYDLPDAALRDRIEADGIDVLVDLSGHTGHNRLGVFARRAAPVQLHYLGYMASTGLTEMDYWIGDAILTPPETDWHFGERVWRLPRVWVSYDGKMDAPLPCWRPDPEGTVRAGSFNNLGKLTRATLDLWAKVLLALPEAKLLLKTKELADAGNRQRILDDMSGHGIPPERIELMDCSTTQGWAEHMAYYDRLDIALDPIGGLGGGTTTCDALWMGLPVITLEGDRMASRMTASMLDAIGHPEWVARSGAEYVAKVAALSRDVEGRRSLRQNLRALLARSPLCDAAGLAGALEAAFEEMFDRWLAKQNRKLSTTP